MYLKNFLLYEDHVELIMTDNSVHRISFNNLTGQIHFAFKNTRHPFIKHPGIYVGCDDHGTEYYMHNHHKTGKPAIVTKTEFCLGQEIYLYEGTSTNAPLQIVESGLKQVLTGEPYNLLGYNCQQFVNRARINENKSEDIEKLAGGVFFAVLVFLGVKAFGSSK